MNDNLDIAENEEGNNKGDNCNAEKTNANVFEYTGLAIKKLLFNFQKTNILASNIMKQNAQLQTINIGIFIYL